MADSPPEMVEWVLNGRRVESPAGMTVLEAARAHGQEIPHFCYHPGLSIAGNCRICLVESKRSPKPIISCSERVAPGLEIETHSDKAIDARNAVMEFQLINHPLDCPVCDKAGECILQNHSYEHGPDRSRFAEEKNIRHTKELGPSIDFWGNRCIVCTRCVRFLEEISGTGELCVIERGDRSVIDVFPGAPLDNPLAGNVVDICPVGALISKDFLYGARIWNMERTAGVCAGCARGCSIEVQTLDGVVKRLVPRHNPQVNDWWMCDHGRHDYRTQHDDRRLRVPRAEEEALLERLADLLAGDGDGRAAFLIDPFLTCEELHLVGTLADRLGGAAAGWLPREGAGERFPGGFVISAEKAPNRRGAEAILGRDVFRGAAESLRAALEAGEIGILMLFAGFPHPEAAPEEWAGAVRAARKRAVFALFEGFWSDGAELLFGATSPFEKEGTWVNEDGILQRVRAIPPARSDPS
ncbi:MAG: 2Fe-2S iron-sulfur cluster-binding protein, partial [Planctomycetota bacterium]